MNNYIKQILEKIKSTKLNENLLVFLIFVIVASFFWFLNAINKKYYADIIIPIKYVNLPDNKLVTGDLSKELKVKVNALGHEIMGYKTSNLKPVIINLKQHSIHNVGDIKNERYYLLTSAIKEEIVTALGKDVEIRTIEPDSLIFKLQDVITKKVAVVGNFNINFKQQYQLKNKISISPDSVNIKGERTKLDTISCVYTDSLSLKQISDSTNINIDLKEIKGTEISPKQVNCIFEVEKFTELSYQLPIKIIDKPEDYSIKLFPATVKLTCNVGFSKYETIYKEQFSVVANYDKNKQRLSLKLLNKPADVSNIRIIPRTVDYLIEKND